MSLLEERNTNNKLSKMSISDEGGRSTLNKTSGTLVSEDGDPHIIPNSNNIVKNTTITNIGGTISAPKVKSAKNVTDLIANPMINIGQSGRSSHE